MYTRIHVHVCLCSFITLHVHVHTCTFIELHVSAPCFFLSPISGTWRTLELLPDPPSEVTVLPQNDPRVSEGEVRERKVWREGGREWVGGGDGVC